MGAVATVDFLSPAERSRRMSLIRKIDTRPEMVVRTMVHRMGFRFRLHRNDLPGTPDLVFSGLMKIIEVRGCFWHSHSCRRFKRRVSARKSYWHPKLMRNVERDKRNLRKLRRMGWRVLTVWECELKDARRLQDRLKVFLSSCG